LRRATGPLVRTLVGSAGRSLTGPSRVRPRETRGRRTRAGPRAPGRSRRSLARRAARSPGPARGLARHGGAGLERVRARRAEVDARWLGGPLAHRAVRAASRDTRAPDSSGSAVPVEVLRVRGPPPSPPRARGAHFPAARG